MARPTGSCPPGRKPLLSDRETALGRRSFRPSPCRGRHPSSPRRRGGSNIHSYFWPMWLKYSFPLVAQILVPTWLKYSLTFTIQEVDFLAKFTQNPAKWLKTTPYSSQELKPRFDCGRISKILPAFIAFCPIAIVQKPQGIHKALKIVADEEMFRTIGFKWDSRTIQWKRRKPMAQYYAGRTKNPPMRFFYSHRRWLGQLKDIFSFAVFVVLVLCYSK